MTSTLIALLLATLFAGVGSVWLAALLSRLALGRYTPYLLSLAAGCLLATAFLHIMPEALALFTQDAAAHAQESAHGHGDALAHGHSHDTAPAVASAGSPAGHTGHTGHTEHAKHGHWSGAHAFFAWVLAGLLLFFMLDKAQLFHHGHSHGVEGELGHTHEAHHHHAAHAHPEPQTLLAKTTLIFGDGLHALSDGVLIAAAFAASPALGWAAALAVLAHEVPHHVSDLVVLQNAYAAQDRNAQAAGRKAVVTASLLGLLTVVGGALGYAFVQQAGAVLPYLLALSASSFIYVALADLIPQLQKTANAQATLWQLLWIGVGTAWVVLNVQLLH